MKVGIPYELKVWGHFKGTPWWSGHCHRHRGTKKQILPDYYLHDLIQCRFLLFLFGLTRAMSCFFSFNCSLHHLQCILSKDTAGRVRWYFHSRSLHFFLYQDAFEELAVQKGLLLCLISVVPVPFQTLHTSSSRTDLLGVQTPCPLRVTHSAGSPAEGTQPNDQFTTAQAKSWSRTRVQWRRQKLVCK